MSDKKNLRFLRVKDVADKTGLSVSHIYALLADRKFPERVKISENVSVFVEHEIDDWIKQKITQGR